MTPLINHIFKRSDELTRVWRKDVTCFDSFPAFADTVSRAGVFFLSDAESDTNRLYDLYPSYMDTCSGVFLPADTCWIEFRMQAGPGAPVLGQRAFLAEMVDGDIMVWDVVLSDLLGVLLGFCIHKDCVGTEWDLSGGAVKVRFSDTYEGVIRTQPKMATTPRFFMECLQLINLPHSLKRIETPAHKMTERRLREVVGRGPALQPWAAIKLDPFAAPASTGGAAKGSAERAYHFCRAHERTRRGRREHVRAHWRGNPEHGVSPRKLYMVRPGERSAGATVH